MLPQAFEVTARRILDIPQRLRARGSLGNASRQRKDRGDERAVLVLLDFNAIFHGINTLLHGRAIPLPRAAGLGRVCHNPSHISRIPIIPVELRNSPACSNSQLRPRARLSLPRTLITIIPKDAIIAEERIRDYLLVRQEEDDKSKFLALAGYSREDFWELVRDIREQILPAEATFAYDRG